MRTKIIGSLEWQADVLDKEMTWAEAKKYAASLGKGWRIPTRAELLTLVDDTKYNPACSVFPSCPSDWFWSSSPCATATGSAWVVHFSNGSTYYSATGYSYRVRCVRCVEADREDAGSIPGADTTARRERIAVAMMQGVVSGIYSVDTNRAIPAVAAEQAVKLADALIAELDKGDK